MPGTEQRQRLADPLAYLDFAQPPPARGEGHVLLDGRGEERRLGELEDEAHPPPQLVLRERARVHAVDEHPPARGHEKKIQVLDERALPRARPADYTEHLLGLDRERDPAERLDLEWGSRRVDVPHVLELDPHRARASLPISMASASSSGVRSFAGSSPRPAASRKVEGRTRRFSSRRSVSETRCSGLTSATSLPELSTSTRSASSSSSRWWVTWRTVLVPRSPSSLPRISRRPAASSIEVGSSRSRTSGSSARSPARATRCFSPPERVWGSRRSYPSRPTAWIASPTRSRISSRSTPRFSSPNATSSSTNGATSPFSGFWKSMPTLFRTSKGAVAGSSCPTRTEPESALRRPTRVDLPPPLGPTTPTYSPVCNSKVTSASAALSEPGYE